MKLIDFISTYCRDLVELYSRTSSNVLDSFDLPYDDEIEDDSGQKMKVIYSGETAIPIMDIISMSKEEFIRSYPDFDCRTLRDQYVDSLIMLDGEEALNHIRGAMIQESARIKETVKLLKNDPQMDMCYDD